MRFDAPWLLFVGAIAAVALAALYRRAETRVDAQALRYSNVAFLRSAMRPRAWITTALRTGWIVALAALVIGAAGPHLTLPMPVRDGNVFICIDTSGSMASSDITPTRAQAADGAARAFVEEAPPGVRIGIITFSGSAELIAPLSADKEATLAAIDQIPPPNGATAIGDALRLAASEFPPVGHRVVILITDGVNNTGVDPQEMAEYFGAHHVPIYTIGIGTPNGDVIGGEESTIDEGALESYAQVSGGAYARAENATQLHAALVQLGRVTTIERRSIAAAPGFFVAAALVLAATLLAGLSLGRFP
ncbi:MAG TPA: VWA domain-containing protein [Candidatus Baltobacteraceae bacterium]|nr:VWA domain-containing protein [Candidatus Baltobacteraceae bacterium]